MTVTATLSNVSGELAITRHGDKIEFLVYQLGEEQFGQSIHLSPNEIGELISYLESLQLEEQR